jgi:hypothetical protein
VSQQRHQMSASGAQGGQLLGQVETRQLQAGGYQGIERRRAHEAMVAPAGLAMEGNGPDQPLATPRNSQGERLRVVDFQDAYQRAIDAGGFIDKTAADVLGLSAGQLSRQLRSEPNYHLSCQRLALLERESHVAFVQLLAQRLGLDLVTPDADALAMGELLQVMGRILPRYRMAVARMAPAVLGDRRHGA